jgi:uncharacterized membrane protein YkvA (DUF1232 family)
MTSDVSSNAQPTEGRFALFVELLRGWLHNLEVNSQLFVEIMNDEQLPMSARMIAIGVLVYVVSPVDIIPDKANALKVLSLIDDVLVMIVGLSIIVSLMPESRVEYYRSKYQAIAQISDYVDILQAILGILWDRLKRFVEKLRSRSYKRQTTEDVAHSPEMQEQLFDETMIYVAKLNLDPEVVDTELAALPPPEKIIGLLASGIEEDEERVTRTSSGSRSLAGVRRLLSSSKDTRDK